MSALDCEDGIDEVRWERAMSAPIRRPATDPTAATLRAWLDEAGYVLCRPSDTNFPIEGARLERELADAATYLQEHTS